MAANRTPLSLAGVEAVIFDLDGVLTDTASAHFESWKETFDAFLRERQGDDFEAFTLQDYQAWVDGKPRYDGVRSFLASRGIELEEGEVDDGPDQPTVHGVGNRKNQRYQEFLAAGRVERFDDAVAFVDRLRARGIDRAVVSSSKNCATVLQAAQMSGWFQARVDGNDLAAHDLKGKPAPDMFIEAAKRLRVAPRCAVVVEDAVSGVEAGRRGGFGLVIGMARAGNADELRGAGADVVVHSFDELEMATPGGAMSLKDADKTHTAMQSLDDIVERIGEHQFALFLDYDGTLTPIVDSPELAVLSEEMRRAVGKLAEECTVAVISGRDLGDVRERVGIEGIAYAGSHGFDIVGPEGESMALDKGEAFLPALERAEEQLRERTQRIDGALIERKRYSLAVHYRKVAAKDVPTVEKHVDQVVEQVGRLKKTHGKKVFDLQPDIDWNKGRAVDWLLDALGLDGPEVVAMYIGDDVTDEDAFRALAGRGVTIAVQDTPSPTAADYRLADPEEVQRFLEALGTRLQVRR